MSLTKKLSLSLFSIFILFFITQLHGQEKFISGKAKIIDGDSIRIEKHRIRLLGIDAPEMKQLCKDKNNEDYACGHLSKNFLISFIDDVKNSKNLREVFCYYSEFDKYNRVLGECFVGPKRIYNLNQAMVLSGHAVAYLRYSYKYLKDQQEAMIKKKGMWSGEFIFPEEWRKKNK